VFATVQATVTTHPAIISVLFHDHDASMDSCYSEIGITPEKTVLIHTKIYALSSTVDISRSQYAVSPRVSTFNS